ncbi:MAG: long-chain fatty acid--CoA ligase [Proteobacteria bacterium]|nr:long-chain fatty acid--CoA ligase [Pseudomonadota bacterium]
MTRLAPENRRIGRPPRQGAEPVNDPFFASISALFLQRCATTPDDLAYRFPRADESWATLTWRQTAERVRRIACGLQALGLQPEERCAIQSSTRIEWILADLGILCAGGATTTIYPSNTAIDCAFIIGDSTSRVVFAEDESQVAKLIEQRPQLAHVTRVITFEPCGEHGDWVMDLAALEELGRRFDSEHPGQYEALIGAITPQRLATLIYTSGTTGRPKGVELTHDCWLFEGAGIAGLGLLGPEDHQYLWLPLSHVLGKVLELAQLHVGFPTTVDGRVPKLIENLAVVRPTFMAASPRIFEKVYSKVLTNIAEAGGIKRSIFHWAEGIGREVSRRRQRDQPLGLALAAQHRLADRLVFAKLRQRFGGRLRFFISGAAPLPVEIAEFFHGAGILILEGYGLTESSAATFVNRPSAYKFGTVGQTIGATEVQIADADGEILLRGRGVMRGYHNLPEQSAEALSADGWLHTGDIGTLDADGFLRITDRKKDLIKTSGGKYIAPQAIEGKLKALCPHLSQILVHGDRRNFCSALITLDAEALAQWAKERGLAGSYAELTALPETRALVQAAVDQLNGRLASYETIKKFAVLPQDFTVEDGDLTPSLKIKRKLVEDKHRTLLDSFYR